MANDDSSNDGSTTADVAPASATAPAPASAPATAPEPAPAKRGFVGTIRQWINDYFFGDDPTIGIAYVPFGFLSIALFTRSPRTNFIFDEQEALLANPYVRSVADARPQFHWMDAFRRDFWGLGPERSIGSYRPIPDLIWRALWGLGARETPFFHHWVNVYLHAANGALMTVLAFRLTRSRSTGWLCGLAFTACAVLTEAVSGVVGIADILGGMGFLFALLALTSKSLPETAVTVFLATMFGLYSKETALAIVPVVPIFALLCGQILHPSRPQRWGRAFASLFGSAVAFVFYVEARRRMFPATLPQELSAAANADKPFLHRTFMAVLRWYAQPILPKDPLNNPLVNADTPHRIAGALRVYWRGLVQCVFPWTLSGDYSAPQEPTPTSLVFPESILGALALVVPFPAAIWVGIRNYKRWKRADGAGASGGEPFVPPQDRPIDYSAILAASALLVVLSFFPVSNIPVLLPTVRAERFWYTPAIGTSLAVGIGMAWLLRKWPRGQKHLVVVGFITAFFLFQGVQARRHANDYTDDLVFWDATRKAVPNSAKAHLNYSVMKGARGDLEARLEASQRALDLAPEWPMANIYLGDTLCRLHRAPEAWPHYVDGFELAPNDQNLIALALQCLWDEKMLGEGSSTRDALQKLDDKHPGTWLDYLGKDILDHGEEHNGVDPKYRPRGYNEGPKE